MIKSFLPNLVTAISDCVQPVSDQCLAKGLIPDSVYKRVLESGGTSEDKARTLILAVKKSTETDSRCLEILLDILDHQLPYTIKEKLLSEIRKELTEKANTCRAVVPSSQTVQFVPSEELPRESVSLQSSLLGRFEDSIRQHERACTEKALLEERLKVKSEEYQQIKDELKALKSQAQEFSQNVEEARRLADCKSEINNFKAKIDELQRIIEEQGMQARRGRDMVAMETKKLFTQLVQQSQQIIGQKDELYKRAVEEKETAIHQSAKDKDEIRIKELEHKLEIQEKELRIRELEVKSEKSFDINPQDVIRYKQLRHLNRCLQKKTSKWRDLGTTLGFSKQELDKIAQLIVSYADGERDLYLLAEMMTQWSKWYPGDSRGSSNFATYTQLKIALVKAGLGDIARDLPSYDDLNNQ